MTKNFLKPMLIVLIAAPLAILLIGPIGIWIGSAISALVYTIHGYLVIRPFSCAALLQAD